MDSLFGGNSTTRTPRTEPSAPNGQSQQSEPQQPAQQPAAPVAPELPAASPGDVAIMSSPHEANNAAGLEHLLAWATEAQERRDWSEAISRWAMVRTHFPDEWIGYSGGVIAWQELGSLDDAEALLQRAEQRFPAHPGRLHDMARIAERKQDWVEAERHWRGFIAVDASRWWAYASLSAALRAQGRSDEAEAVLLDAQTVLPQEPALFGEYARHAEARQDWDAALARWMAMRGRFPDDWESYSGEIAALRRLNRSDELTALLNDAMARFPQHSGVQHDLARLAETQSNWPQAERSWRRFIELDPSSSWGHIGLVQALRAQGRVDDAEATLHAAQTTLPDDAALFVEHARLAEARGDWAAAMSRWQTLRERFPNEWAGYAGCISALRELGRQNEAEAMLLEAALRFPGHASLHHDLARLAESRGDWLEAEDRWRQFIAVEPDPWWAHAGLAGALRAQNKFSDAEGILLAAQERMPRDMNLFVEYARLAEAQGDWSLALSRWQAVRERFPGEWLGHSGCVASLRKLGQVDEAEALLREADEHHPEQAGPQQDLARLAEARGDWAEAELRWRNVLTIDADRWWAYTDLANALRRQGREVEAEAVLVAAQARFPQEVAVFAGHAELLEHGGHWSEAAARWEVVHDRWPDLLRGYLGFGTALARIGRFDQADAVLEEAMRRFPSSHDAVAVFAEAADLRHDWPQAVLRWTHARKMFPDLEGFGHRLFEARLRLYEGDPTDDKAHHDVVPAMPEDRRRMYDVMMCFESLGNGCEFGTVQRTYGAEPLGLLRWSAIAPQHLVAALDSNFAGVGSVEQTDLSVHRREYILHDTVFEMGMHTFITEDKISREKMLQQSYRRLKFLSEKLMNDIREAEKIFVYFYPFLDDDQVRALFAALRRHGDATLFVVQVTRDGHPAGTVEVAEPGLMMGYVATAGFMPGSGAHKIPIEAWGDICCVALDKTKDQGAAAARAPRT